jgi:hypothetical protein
MKKLLFILLFITGNLQAQTHSYLGQPSLTYLAGPKINFNISKTEDKVSNRISGGFEVSVWAWGGDGMPKGADFGFEVEKDRVRIYADIQAGMLLGLAVGPVVEIANKRANLGFQTALWGTVFIGGEAKYRRINSKNYFAPGFMFKLPLHTKKENGNYTGFGILGLINK